MSHQAAPITVTTTMRLASIVNTATYQNFSGYFYINVLQDENGVCGFICPGMRINVKYMVK